MKRGKLLRFVAVTLAVTTGLMSVGAPRAQAMMAPTQVAVSQTMSDRAADMRTIQSTLENKMVKQRLQDLGLSETQITERFSKLSDQKLHQVAMQIEKQNPAASDSSTAITILIVVAVVALVIWLWDHL